MKVIAKVLDVSTRGYRKDGEPKTAADLVLKSGTSTIQVTLFDKDVGEGRHLIFDKLTGQEVVVDISAEVYRGNVNYRLGFEDPTPLTQPTPVKTKAA
ncbi:hypothetical protein Misp06_01089 [Microbulbifer sp. NBRC 101763]|uniref:hypothetical protein n=1 Tax=Microbulbifer sp. NBRC 101763 TaxID=1113820 RepID=UPI0030A97428